LQQTDRHDEIEQTTKRRTDRQTNIHPHFKTYKYSTCELTVSVNYVTLHSIQNLLFTALNNFPSLILHILCSNRLH